jgi:hypothetical protein
MAATARWPSSILSRALSNGVFPSRRADPDLHRDEAARSRLLGDHNKLHSGATMNGYTEHSHSLSDLNSHEDYYEDY